MEWNVPSPLFIVYTQTPPSSSTEHENTRFLSKTLLPIRLLTGIHVPLTKKEGIEKQRHPQLTGQPRRRRLYSSTTAPVNPLPNYPSGRLASTTSLNTITHTDDKPATNWGGKGRHIPSPPSSRTKRIHPNPTLGSDRGFKRQKRMRFMWIEHMTFRFQASPKRS